MKLIGKNVKLKIVDVKNKILFVDTIEYGILKTTNNDLIINYKPGDIADFFMLPDGNNIPILLSGKSNAQVDEFARLRVSKITDAGAFIDIGLDADIFCPKSEQLFELEKNKYYNFYIYLNSNKNKIEASTDINKFISNDISNLKENQEVEIFILNKTNLGYNVIINNKSYGLLYNNEIFGEIKSGIKTKAVIKKIRDDKKIDLRLFKNDSKDILSFEEKILDYLKKCNGSMDITDDSEPEVIYQTFGISKKNFKKAIGGLYRKGLIELQTHKIILKK